MSSDHVLRLALYFHHTGVQRNIYDAVVELNDHHVLLIVSHLFCDKLSTLNFVTAEPCAVFFPVCGNGFS